MKTFLIGLFAIFLTFGLAAHDAEAKRLGGGKSFGMQRSVPARQEAAPAPQRQQTAGAPAQPAPQKRSWMGPIAGLAAGLGLAALASHFGFGEGMANILMLALLAMAAFMLVRFLMRRNAPQPSMQYAGMPQAAPAAFDATPAAMGSSPAVGSFPPGFDADVFAREAKLNFIRLQAAFDAGNLDDLRAFTTPEIFAELRLELNERGTAVQTTDVMTLDAEVLEAVEESGRYVASVRFTGLVREAADQGATPLNEVWHLTKPANGQGGWVVAGIQQA